MSRPLSLIAALLASNLASVQAQAPTERSPVFDGTRLKAFHLAGTVYRIRGADTAPAGTFAEELVVHHEELVLVNTTKTAVLGQILDTLIARLPDLKPIAYYQRGPVDTSRIDFRGIVATGSHRTLDGSSTPISFILNPSAYAEPTMLLILESATLQEGSSFTVRMFNPVMDSTTVPVTITVTGSTLLEGRSCWTILVRAGEGALSYWIDKTSLVPRRLLIPIDSRTSLLLEQSHDHQGIKRAP